jgi:hypothetical protein
VVAGFAVDVVVAVLVLVLVEAAVEGVAVDVDVLAAVDVEVAVEDEWSPLIIFSSLWQPPSVSIKAAAHATTEKRMVESSP